MSLIRSESGNMGERRGRIKKWPCARPQPGCLREPGQFMVQSLQLDAPQRPHICPNDHHMSTVIASHSSVFFQTRIMSFQVVPISQYNEEERASTPDSWRYKNRKHIVIVIVIVIVFKKKKKKKSLTWQSWHTAGSPGWWPSDRRAPRDSAAIGPPPSESAWPAAPAEPLQPGPRTYLQRIRFNGQVELSIQGSWLW